MSEPIDNPVSDIYTSTNTPEQLAIANALQLEAAQRRASRFGFGQICTAHAQTAISQLSIKIPTSPLHSATSIS